MGLFAFPNAVRLRSRTDVELHAKLRAMRESCGIILDIRNTDIPVSYFSCLDFFNCIIHNSSFHSNPTGF